jgi:hypothetical protein
MTLEFAKGKGVDVKFHGRGKNELSHYCGQCEVGQFSITLEIVLTCWNLLTLIENCFECN